MQKLTNKWYEFWALRWARRMGYTGRSLPMGGTTATTCPMHQATGFHMHGDYYFDGQQTEYTPLGVRGFIFRHDSGRYPHLLPQAGDIGIDIDEGEIIPLEQPNPQKVPQETPPVREPEKV